MKLSKLLSLGTLFFVIIFLMTITFISSDAADTGKIIPLLELTISDKDGANINQIYIERIWDHAPGELANPYSIYHSDDYLVIQDLSSYRPLPVFKKDGTFLHYIGDWGKGPGEFSREGHSVIGIRDGDILIYDRETSRILSYEVESGKFVAESNSGLKTFPYLHGDKLINRAAIPYEHFAYGVTLNYDLSTEVDTVVYGRYDELDVLYAAKYNHLLKQGAVIEDDDNNIFIAFNNSSLIVGFDIDGNVIFYNDKPAKLGTLPDLRNIELPASLRGGLIGPPLNMFPKHYVSVAVNDSYVLGLYSGFQIKSREDLLDSDKANEGYLVNFFDKKNSDFITTLTLDFPLKSFVLDNETLYGISTYPDVTLVKYQLNTANQE